MQMKKMNFFYNIHLIKKDQINNAKLNNKKINLINVELKFNKQISNEKDSQLQQFSEIYFKKIKKNSTISEK